MPGSGDVLRATGITKRFGATVALDSVGITLRPGEVHALLGENGAGKSTLVKILVGAQRPDSGSLTVDDQPVDFHSVRDAVAHGVVPIYQQLSLLPHLSVTENLFAFELARGAGWRRTRKSWGAEARKALDALGLEVDENARVGDLSLAERQLIEIARSALVDCRLLVLDEPTTALTAREVEQLFTVVRNLRDRGRAVLFISHRLEEVMAISDRISVLRNGRSELRDVPMAGLTSGDVIRAMVGSDVEPVETSGSASGEPVLEARGLSSPGAFDDVSLTVHRGEVVGVVGLIGSGAMALAEVLAGARPGTGSVAVDGKALRLGSRRGALRSGVGYLPGDRDRDGVFPTLTVLNNASASALDVIAAWGTVNRNREARAVGARLTALSVKPADPQAPITALSGGNQQKVLLARMLSGRPAKVLVAAEPTRGVDIGARRDIHQALRDDAQRGAAVLMMSTDLDEVVALADRVLVMRAGRLVAELPATVGAHGVLAHMTGAAA
jgi:ABC-type sugar transport system ATPase subunit